MAELGRMPWSSPGLQPCVPDRNFRSGYFPRPAAAASAPRRALGPPFRQSVFRYRAGPIPAVPEPCPGPGYQFKFLLMKPTNSSLMAAC